MCRRWVAEEHLPGLVHVGVGSLRSVPACMRCCFGLVCILRTASVVTASIVLCLGLRSDVVGSGGSLLHAYLTRKFLRVNEGTIICAA
jgi:hypothetical protein